MTVKIKVPESGVLCACLDLLAAEHIWHERRNTVPVLVPNGRGGKRPIKVAANGTADIMATPVVRMKWLHTCGDMIADSQVEILWVETKSDSGAQTQAQKDFEKEVKAAGHHYIVVRSSDELKRWLIEHGAMRSK